MSSGSSASTVSAPTAIASTSARCRWKNRSAAAPVSRTRASAPADEAVRGHRGFRDHERPPLRHPREERRVQPRAPALRPTPTSTPMPCSRRYAKPPPVTRGFGSCIAATTREMPARDDPLDARSGAADVAARLERAVERGARARAPAASSATTSACGPPARRCAPWPTTTPSGDTTTAPTIGLGDVRAAAALGQEQRALHEVRVE